MNWEQVDSKDGASLAARCAHQDSCSCFLLFLLFLFLSSFCYMYLYVFVSFVWCPVFYVICRFICIHYFQTCVFLCLNSCISFCRLHIYIYIYIYIHICIHTYYTLIIVMLCLCLLLFAGHFCDRDKHWLSHDCYSCRLRQGARQKMGSLNCRGQ